MTSNTDTNIVKLFPGEPSAIELYDDDTDMTITVPVEASDKISEDSEIRTMAMILIGDLGKRMHDIGLDPHESPHDFCMVSEAIISYIYSHYAREHPLQEIAGSTIVLEDIEEEIVYRFIPPKVSIMKPESDNPDGGAS